MRARRLFIYGSLALLALLAAERSAGLVRRWKIKRKVQFTRTEMRTVATAIEAYSVDDCIYPACAIGHPGPGRVRSYNDLVVESTGNVSGVGELPCFLMCDWSVAGGRFDTLTSGGGTGCSFKQPMHLMNDSGTTPAGEQPPPGLLESFKYHRYLEAYPVDPFCADRGATFVYWSLFPGAHPLGGRLGHAGGTGWILVSPGPDGDYDLADAYYVYNPAVPQPSRLLLAGTNNVGSAFTYDPTNGLVSNGDIWCVKQ